MLCELPGPFLIIAEREKSVSVGNTYPTGLKGVVLAVPVMNDLVSSHRR